MPSKKLIYDHFKQGIGRRRPRSVDDAELGHYTFLFYRGRQRNVQRFCLVLVAAVDVAVVCLRSLLSAHTWCPSAKNTRMDSTRP